jgi:hypothetical protein
MAFKVRGSLLAQGAPVLKRQILTNSQTSVQLDSMKLASGFCALGTAGALVFGHLMGHASKEGTPLNTSGAAGAAIGSYAGSFASASDNQTVAMVKGEVDVSKYTLYTEITSGVLGATTGSNLAGYKMDLTRAVQQLGSRPKQ